MKKVQIYSPYWSTHGGGEKYILALAHALSLLSEVEVTLLSTDPTVTMEGLGKYFGIRLEKIRFMTLAKGSLLSTTTDADLFVCMSNFRFIESRARKKAFLLQVPYAPISAFSILQQAASGHVTEGVKDLYRKEMFSRIRKGGDLAVVYSQFVHDSLLRNFGLRTSILHPPIDDFLLKNVRKKNIILSVGRFFRALYNDKRYDILTKTFRSLSRSELKGWEYHVAGSSPNDAASLSLLEELRRENEGFPVYFHVNEAHETLKRLYNEAKIFWHAAGFGSDEERHPERMEHFGMTTAEAMSAGCIPVVIRKGGQKEIVQHGVNGFLWNTVDELAGYTAKIAYDEIPIAKTRRNARQRFKYFSTQRFQKEAARIFSPLLTPKKR
jgi:glycosyltransferase involved in cell wall biosynthesis